MFLYAHAPRPIRSPSDKKQKGSRERTSYPDYEQSFVIEEAEEAPEEPENNHVITIDI